MVTASEVASAMASLSFPPFPTAARADLWFYHPAMGFPISVL